MAIISCNKNNIVGSLFSKHYPNISKTWVISTPKELIAAMLPFGQMSRSSSPNSLLQATKINVPTSKHPNNYVSLPLILPTFTVPNWIGQLPAGLLPWHELARAIKSSIIDTTFIQYWGINFTVGWTSWHKHIIRLGNCVLPEATFDWNTSSKLNQHKGRDLRHPILAFGQSPVFSQLRLPSDLSGVGFWVEGIICP